MSKKKVVILIFVCVALMVGYIFLMYFIRRTNYDNLHNYMSANYTFYLDSQVVDADALDLSKYTYTVNDETKKVYLIELPELKVRPTRKHTFYVE